MENNTENNIMHISEKEIDQIISLESDKEDSGIGMELESKYNDFINKAYTPFEKLEIKFYYICDEIYHKILPKLFELAKVVDELYRMVKNKCDDKIIKYKNGKFFKENIDMIKSYRNEY